MATSPDGPARTQIGDGAGLSKRDAARASPTPARAPDSTYPHASTFAFAELHAITNFSFLRGASHPEELVRTAHTLGYRAIAITDECSVAGVVKAHMAARDLDIKLIIGAEFHIPSDSGAIHLVLLSPDRRAYGQLSELVTLARRRAPKGDYSLGLDDLRQRV
ncbi:MAG: PHP domain-containing protein, partial [Gammaproteobacteria bacterium]|nr:PHP domain-containing protein [Gammaproteobacteria bacterium]